MIVSIVIQFQIQYFSTYIFPLFNKWGYKCLLAFLLIVIIFQQRLYSLIEITL